jgi:hypothetical protein
MPESSTFQVASVRSQGEACAGIELVRESLAPIEALPIGREGLHCSDRSNRQGQTMHNGGVILLGDPGITDVVKDLHYPEALVICTSTHGNVLGLRGLDIEELDALRSAATIVVCSVDAFDPILHFLALLGITERSVLCADQHGYMCPVRDVFLFRRKGILVASMPKSGTAWIDSNLRIAARHGAKRPVTSVVQPSSPSQMVFNSHSLLRIAREGGFHVGHFELNSFNQSLLNKAVTEWGLYVIVQLRDPRQAIVSWIHHENKAYRENEFQLEVRQYPKHYFSFTFEERIDYHLKHQFMNLINWIRGWKALYASPLAQRCLFLTHEKLSSAPTEYSSIFCDYLGVPDQFISLSHRPKKGELNFRSGTRGEWRSSLTPRQQEQMLDVMREEGVVAFLDELNA